MPEAKRPTLLVIDDSDMHRMLLRHTLEEEYRVIEATDGHEGLRQAREELPDLILLDVVMPEPDGFAVCRALKEEEATRKIPVLFLTGRSDPDAVQQGFALGAADYIPKPCHPAEVVARIANHLALKEARESLAAQNVELQQTIREQEISIELARKTLAFIDDHPPRYTDLGRGLALFSHGYCLPCRAEGGDHFFVRTLPTGNPTRTVFSVKDQSGHAVKCILRSIFTDLTHNALICRTDLPLEGVLTRLNETVNTAGLFNADDFFTAFSGEIDHATLEFRYASAGHPPLLLIRQGEVRLVPGPRETGCNLPMGVAPEIPISAGSLRLEAGDMLIAYTDGLTEMPLRTEGRVLCCNGLAELTRRILATRPDLTVTALMEELLATIARRSGVLADTAGKNSGDDDITLLGLQIEDQTACRRLALKPADFSDLDAMIHAFLGPLEEELPGRGYQGSVEFRIHTACSEALLNAWKHGNREEPHREIEMRWRFGNDLFVEIIDQGHGFDPAAAPDPFSSPQLLAESGRGIFIIRQSACAAQWLGNGNHLRLRFGRETRTAATPGLAPGFSLWEVSR